MKQLFTVTTAETSLVRHSSRIVQEETTALGSSLPNTSEPTLLATSPAPLSSSLSLLRTIERFENGDSPADYATCAAILRACSNSNALSEARRIHDLIRQQVESGSPVTHHGYQVLFHAKASLHEERCRYLGNLLLHVYGNCGAADEALKLFDCMPHHDSFSWNFIMKAHVRQGNERAIIELFDLMLQHGTLPSKFIFVTYISVFHSRSILKYGMRVHSRIANSAVEWDMIVETALLKMYCKCGNLKEGRRLFNKMVRRDAVSWNAIVSAYAQEGHRKEALHLSHLMLQEGFELRRDTIIALLATCTGVSALSDGKWIHSQAKDTSHEPDVALSNALIAMYGKCGSLQEAELVFDKMCIRNRATFQNMFAACGNVASLSKSKWLHKCFIETHLQLDISTGNSLISMYGKCGDMGEACQVFDRMDERDLITWNALLSAHAQNGDGEGAIHVLKQMQLQGVLPNRVTYVSVLNACAALEDEFQGQLVDASLRGSEFEFDLILGTALVYMYGKFDRMMEAKDVFHNILNRDVACWNAIISVFAHQEGKPEALMLFLQMQEEAELPDKITFISTITGCWSETDSECVRMHARVACTEFATEIFIGNALINTYGKCGALKNALSVFEKMPKRDNITYINVISSCASNGAVSEGRNIHVSIMGSPIESEVVVGNALLNMYGKCGCFQHALEFFNQMPEKSVVTFNVIITTYSHRDVWIAMHFLREMCLEGVRPDSITFLSLLSICSHAGLVDEGYGYLHLMIKNYGMAPREDHFNCMIDMLARAGRLDEAEHLIKTMPCKASVVTWTALLGACQSQVDLERGVRAAERVMKLNPSRPATYVALSNIYMAAGMGDEAAMIMQYMRTKCPEPGHDMLTIYTLLQNIGIGHEICMDSHPEEVLYAIG